MGIYSLSIVNFISNRFYRYQYGEEVSVGRGSTVRWSHVDAADHDTDLMLDNDQHHNGFSPRQPESDNFGR